VVRYIKGCTIHGRIRYNCWK